MTNKRKREADAERRAKRQRRRASSETTLSDNDAEKRQALKFLLGRICSDENHPAPPELEPEDASASDYIDENDDPLLDSVPVDMDPEQLGFLVCAQETLRFLHGRGIPPHHPIFAHLRTRLLQGIGEMAVA